MPKKPKKEGRRAPLYIITLKNGQSYMTSDIFNVPKGATIRKTIHFCITRKRLKG